LRARVGTELDEQLGALELGQRLGRGRAERRWASPPSPG
jgi:hypothetical protein